MAARSHYIRALPTSNTVNARLVELITAWRSAADLLYEILVCHTVRSLLRQQLFSSIILELPFVSSTYFGRIRFLPYWQ
jgi:hypothetical protein